MSPLWLKHIYSVLCILTWRPMPAAARTRLHSRVSSWVGAFARSATSSALSASVIVCAGYLLLSLLAWNSFLSFCQYMFYLTDTAPFWMSIGLIFLKYKTDTWFYFYEKFIFWPHHFIQQSDSKRARKLERSTFVIGMLSDSWVVEEQSKPTFIYSLNQTCSQQAACLTPINYSLNSEMKSTKIKKKNSAYIIFSSSHSLMMIWTRVIKCLLFNIWPNDEDFIANMTS